MKKFKIAWSRSEKKHRNPIEKGAEFGFEVESLESRKMLAGTVDVVVKGDNMIISGDSADNNITVTVVAGDIAVVGSGGTTVNGGTTTNLPAADLNKLTIKMKDGNDVALVLGGVNPQGSVRMIGAAGNDTLIFTGDAGDKLQIIGGTGDDYMGIGEATVAGKFTLKGGANDDTLSISTGSYNGKVIAIGGGGNDTANVINATFTSDVKANMGHGADTINLRAGVSFTDGRFNFGGGDDFLQVNVDPLVTGELILNGGGGFDTSVPDPDNVVIPNVTIKSFEGTI